MIRKFLVPLLVIVLLFSATPAVAASEVAFANQRPIGELEVIRPVANGVRIAGWTLDPDSVRSNGLHVYVDGQYDGYVRANRSRPDVDAEHGLGANHGFDATLPLADGGHRVCVYALNKGPGLHRRLACRRVYVNPGTTKPIGDIESVNVNGATALVSGWALDPDTNDSIGVHVYVNGQFGGGKKASGRRDDIANQHGQGARHGFGITVPINAGERNEICAYAIDHARLPGKTVKFECQTIGGTSNGGPGVVVSPTGVVVPVLEKRADGTHRVLTPCLNEAVLSGGNFVGGVDVVIDAGHGGSESGAVGPNGLYEKRLNLIVALKLKDILEARGYSALVTRTTDVRLPLRFRAEIANALAPQVFVSVHHNGGAVRRSSDPGTETFYQHDSSESRRLAGILYEELNGAMGRYNASFVDTIRQGTNTRLNDDGDDLYGIHRYTPDVVSVITEALYLSNRSEAELLAQSSVQDAEAVALADGIIRFITTNDAGSRFNGAFTDAGSSGTGGTDNCTDPRLS